MWLKSRLRQKKTVEKICQIFVFISKKLKNDPKIVSKSWRIGVSDDHRFWLFVMLSSLIFYF